jgi:hypothetical protein
VLSWLRRKKAKVPAVATSLHTQEFDNDAISYVTSSFARTNGRPLLAAVFSSQPDPSVNPTLTGHSLTWTRLDSEQTTTGTPRRYVAVYEAYPTSSGSGTLTINFGGANTQSSCRWARRRPAEVEAQVVAAVAEGAERPTPVPRLSSTR